MTGNFGLKGVSGVGVSFGAARIFDVMEELSLFPKNIAVQLKCLLVAFDKPSHQYAFSVLNKLRAAGISAELYPQPSKMNKQMKYANARSVPFVVVIGSEEMNSGKLSFKKMATGDQEKLTLDELVEKLK